MNDLKEKKPQGGGGGTGGGCWKQKGLEANIRPRREKTEGHVTTQSHTPGDKVNPSEGPSYPAAHFPCAPGLLWPARPPTRKGYGVFNT